MRKQKEHDHLREPVCAKCACVCVKPRARRDDASINHDLDAPQMTRLDTVHSDTHERKREDQKKAKKQINILSKKIKNKKNLHVDEEHAVTNVPAGLKTCRRAHCGTQNVLSLKS